MSANTLPTSPSILDHIFRKGEGHLPDTPEHRQLLTNLVNDEAARLKTDRHGNTWYAKTQHDGTQLWAQLRNGIIIDGGLNLAPKMEDPQTGLKRP